MGGEQIINVQAFCLYYMQICTEIIMFAHALHEFYTAGWPYALSIKCVHVQGVASHFHKTCTCGTIRDRDQN